MDFRRPWLALMAVLFAVALAAPPASAGTPARRGAKPFKVQRPARTNLLDTSRHIDVNQINMFLTNYGTFAWDVAGQGQPPGLFYPKGTNKSAVYAAGLWLGADVGGEIRTVVAEYSQEYGPGAMVGGTFDDPSNPDYKTYKVARFTGNPKDTAHVVRDANEAAIEDDLVHHSWSEYMKGAVPYGAPWTTWRLPNTETSDPADSVDVPGPSLETGKNIMPDMLCWGIYNDADPSRHDNDAGDSSPLGVEVQQTTFAFNRQGALGNIVFLRWMIINKGGQQLDSMFVSIWSDTDLGGAADDLVGCDTLLSMGYTYNSTNNDQLYGSAPPAVGYDFFQGPLRHRVPGDNLELPMTSFNKYINGTDPASTGDTYNYMNGILPDGSDVIDPQTGNATKFFHPGDPTTRTGWLDSNPADRRHLLTSGPFYMAPGDTQTIVAALVIGNGNDRLSSVSAMKFYDEFAQLAFDEGFNLPNPPQQPDVNLGIDHGQVTLSWDAKSRTDYAEPGYTFEGYNVYQGASIAGPWKRLATFDEINGTLTIRDTVFDIITGRTITDYPVAYGTDAGVQFNYVADQDAVRGGPLHDGTEYFFAVTAYAYGPTQKLAVVENAQLPIRVIPQRPPLGTDPNTAGGTVTYSRTSTLLSPATDRIELRVVDADSVKGHDYRINFAPFDPPYPRVVVGADTLDAKFGWNLTDITTGDTLLKKQTNKSGDELYRVFDGILFKVIGSHVPAFQEADYRDLNPANPTALEGVNFGLASFGGGADAGLNFFGSTLDPATMPDSFTTVQVRFSHTATQKAYRFVRMQTVTGDPPASYPNRGYLNRGFVDVPFQVWDAINDIQLDAAVLEKEVTDDAGNRLSGASQLASSDSTWGPDDSGDGGREMIFVYRREYSDTPKPELAVDQSILDGTVPVLYWVGPKLISASDVVDDGDQFEWVWANPADDNDFYDISTSKLVRSDVAFAKGKLDRIRVVPNPYYNRSRYELNQFARVVRFMNMPEVATVRIFTLAGQLIRTLQKTDPTSSLLNWDLLTENRLPVASGIYIYHVDAPGVGTTFGRMVVFMEKERLNNF
jgi:hypothetical protein